MKRMAWVAFALALTLPVMGCERQEAQEPGGGAGFRTTPIPGVPPAELGETYQRAYVSMATAYMELLQQDYDAALPHARAAHEALVRIREMGGETLPQTVTQDIATAGELVRMIEERHPSAAQRSQDLMISMTNEAERFDLARPDGMGGGAGATERKFEGPGVAQPEPPPGTRTERRPQAGPSPGR